MASIDIRPLIVTAALPPREQDYFNRLRQLHFPPERNHLSAHVTLFHALPGSEDAAVRRALATIAAEAGPPEAHVTGLMSLGRGTAFRLDAPGLLAVREDLADQFQGLLTAQDVARPRLHVTIQNKVSGAEAKALLATLQQDFEPWRFAFRGLELWRYLGGPWQAVRSYAFRGQPG